MRFKQRMKVLFPHPDGPISAVISPAWICIDTSSIAALAP